MSPIDPHALGWLDAGRDALEKAGLDIVAKTVVERIAKRLGWIRESEDVKRVETSVERVKETFEEFQAEIERRSKAWDMNRVIIEASDPGTTAFIDDALAAAERSKSEPQRRLFGRLIAHRFEVETDGDAITLHRAMRTIGDLSEAQLIALAVLALFDHFGTPVAPFTSHSDAEEWLAARYAPLFDYLKPLPWTYGDLEALGSVGAISGGVFNNPSMPGEHGAHPLDQWLMIHGVTFEIAPDSGSPEAFQRAAARYPFMTGLARVGGGRAPDDATHVEYRLVDYNRLDSIELTPLGRQIGREVLMQLTAFKALPAPSEEQTS